MSEEIPVGAHLVSPRGVYTHHGIYIGNGSVIHYSGFCDERAAGPIEITDLQRFSSGNGFEARTYKDSFAPKVIVARAKSRLGEQKYSLFSNNCEHFCHWCITGDHRSPQVDRVFHVAVIEASAITAATPTLARLAFPGGLAATKGLLAVGALSGTLLASPYAIGFALAGGALALLGAAFTPAPEDEEEDPRG